MAAAPVTAAVTPSPTPWRTGDARRVALWFLEADLKSSASQQSLLELTGRGLQGGEVLVRSGVIFAASRRQAEEHRDSMRRHWQTSDVPELRAMATRARIAERVVPEGTETGRFAITKPTSRQRLMRWYETWQADLREVRPLLARADRARSDLKKGATLREHRNLPADPATVKEFQLAEMMERVVLDTVAQLLQDVHLDFERLAPSFLRRGDLGRPTRRRRQELVSGSLLGEIAYGIYQELQAARRLAVCELSDCGVLFTPRDARNKYHSDRCRKKANPESPRRRKLYMRKYRKDQATATQMAAHSSRNPRRRGT